MASRTVATTTASNSLGGSYFTSLVTALNNKFSEGAIITASHFTDLADILITAAGHNHDWTDQYGIHTAGNFNSEGYSTTGSTEPKTVDVLGTDFGGISGCATDYDISVTHYNFCNTIYTALRSHRHTTDDRTA